MSFVEAFHQFWNHAPFVSVTITHWQEAITYSKNVLMHQPSSPGKFILHHWTCQILIQITPGYPRAPSHYLNRYWQINNEVMWHLTGIIFYIFHTFTHASPARCISVRPHGQAMYLQHDFLLQLSHSHSCQSCSLHICPASWTSNVFTAWLYSTTFTQSLMPVLLAAYLSSLMDKQCIYSMTFFYIFHTQSLMQVLLAPYLSSLVDKQCIYSMTFFYNFHTVTHASPARCISVQPHGQAMHLQHDFILHLSHTVTHASPARCISVQPHGQAMHLQHDFILHLSHTVTHASPARNIYKAGGIRLTFIEYLGK